LEAFWHNDQTANPGKRAQDRAKNWIQYSIPHHKGQQIKTVAEGYTLTGMAPENCV